MDKSFINWDKIPPLRRARGYRLYSYDNKTLLDLYLDGAAAIMGHKSGSALLHLKNTAQQGVFAPYPSIQSNRLKKALSSLYPDLCNFVIISNFKRAKELLASVAFYHPLLPLENREDLCATALRLIKIPLAGNATPAVVASPKGIALPPNYPSRDEGVSAFLLSAATRAVYDFITFKTVYSTINFDWWDLALQKSINLIAHSNNENQTDNLQKDGFMRKGAYLYYLGDEESYALRFDKALKHDVLIAPHWGEPSLLPFQSTPGERNKIVKALLSPL